ncbi:MAG TPA: DNA-3-methyladenine glycosylase I, partial [Paenirhodobacter sp.]
SLAAFFWRFEAASAGMRATSAESEAMSKELRKHGWKFVGPTTAYAFMQAMGLVNDHAEGCATRTEVAVARAGFTPPG